MLAFGIVAPTIPKLISDFLGNNTARASEYLGFFVSTFAFMQFFFLPVLGMLSDRFWPLPRRSNLELWSCFRLLHHGLGADAALAFPGPRAGRDQRFQRIHRDRLHQRCNCAEKRSKAFGWLGAAFGVGFVVGPAIGGWLGMHNPRLPFWVAGVGSLVNACYGFFVLPESLPPEKRKHRFDWGKANPLGSLRLLRSHAELLGLASVNFLGYLAHEVYLTVYILYAMYRFHWDQGTVGGSLAVVGISQIVVSGALVGLVVKRLGERRSLLAGLVFGALGFAMFGWAPSAVLFLVAIAVNSLWTLAGPTSQSIMTRRVSPSEQGELQGAIGSLRGIAMIIGPQIFSMTFAYFIVPQHLMPGAPWYLAASLLLAALLVAWRVAHGGNRDHDPIGGGLANVEVEIS